MCPACEGPGALDPSRAQNKLGNHGRMKERAHLDFAASGLWQVSVALDVHFFAPATLAAFCGSLGRNCRCELVPAGGSMNVLAGVEGGPSLTGLATLPTQLLKVIGAAAVLSALVVWLKITRRDTQK